MDCIKTRHSGGVSWTC